MEEIGVLADHGEVAAHRVHPEIAKIPAAQANAPLLRVEETQKKADDRGFAGAARSDDGQPFAGSHLEAQAAMHRAAAPGVGEAHVFEGHRRRQRFHFTRVGSVLDRRLGVEEFEEGLGGGPRQHALMQERPQLAQGAEYLDPHHQDHEQGLDTHCPGGHPEGSQAEGRGGANGHPGIGDAAGHAGDGHDAHGAAEKLAGFLCQPPAPLAALAESLERRQSLDRVEELGGESPVGEAPPLALGVVPAGEDLRRDQRENGGGQQNRGDRRIQMDDEGEDHHRRQHGHEHLGQELAEIGLQLFHPVDHGDDHAARGLVPEIGGTEAAHLGENPLAETHLDPRRGVMRDHVPPILEEPAADDDGTDDGKRNDQRCGGLALKHLGEKPAHERQLGDADRRRQPTHGRGSGDAQSYAFGESPESGIDGHPWLRGRLAGAL